MRAPLPLDTVARPSFDRAITLPLFSTLAARLDAALIAVPVITTLGCDPVVEALERSLGLSGTGLVSRRIRVLDGRSLTVTAVPSAIFVVEGKARLLALKRAGRTIGRRILLVPEGVLDRDPRLADALLIAGCAGVPVAPSDRVALLAALTEAGGSLPLADAAEIMRRADDPVAAVLALVAGRVVALDLRAPIGPDSAVMDLAGRTWVLGGRR